MEGESVIENILRLDPTDEMNNTFKGITLLDGINHGFVFGGQWIGQALAAASKTVDCVKIVHSLHAYFLVSGDNDMPITYRVYQVRDGINFATRRVEAIQKGIVVFTLLASFKKEEIIGFYRKEALMPLVPQPEMLLSTEDPRVTKLIARWPIEIRFCKPENSTDFKFLFRAKGKVSDDEALHRCVVAYASDLIFLGVSLTDPQRARGLKTDTIALDHSMWFHRPVRADNWLLFVIQMDLLPAHNGRGFFSGQMFTREGKLAVSLTQQALIRKPKIQGTLIKPKMYSLRPKI